MDKLEIKIISTIDSIGPTFISKLANRILENQNLVKECVKKLVAEKILERVENIMVSYKTKEANTVTKHRNHTYYKLTKKGEQLAKSLAITDNSVREAFKTYNKALQNILDNPESMESTSIDCVIDFPYSQENPIKNILKEEFFTLEKTYDKTVTLRGKVEKNKIEKIKLLPNVVVLS
ncbi:MULTISPECIES: DUF2250 domain-containing protein [unclassified Fusobacterium]|uniref:DUF2250 domain-containing protein n=1 Tax=unclassified Fusobacterium TaxID=2648384 RepID=UPI00263097C7|nr:DUF2250 domain-containing protein [Fusobacterium sp.]